MSLAAARRAALTPEALGAPREAWVLAADGMTRDVAGMPHLLRTACALRAAGVRRVVVVGAPVDLAGLGADPRLAGTTLECAGAPPRGDDGDAILVVRGDRVFHRDGPRLLARASGGTRVVADWPGLVLTSRARARVLVSDGLEPIRADGEVVTIEPPFLGFDVPLGDPRAERNLLLSLRKPIDGVAARFLNRYVSLWLTRRLLRSGIRPNHVSIFTMVCGLAAAVVCGLGGWTAAVIGVVLLELGSILDGVDGELARLRYQGSRLGEWLDTLSDDLANAAWIVGCAANLSASGARWAWPSAAVAIACFLFSQGFSYAKLVRIGSGDLLAISWNVLQGSRLMRFLYLLVKRDLFVTGFVVLVLIGRLDAVLLFCVAGAIGVAIGVAAEAVGARRTAR